MTNRLAEESSPYLLQHQHNPVDWYPWGPEALARAREEDRPILLSIGYSACHWCHVMERESFEDPETAELMNRSFVNVKVDREERPDLDSVYMTAVQAMTGRGGWPLTVFLTPEAVPFYGGTYFPPRPMRGSPSFRQVLRAVREAWESRREEVRRTTDELVAALDDSTKPGSGRYGGDGANAEPPGPDVLRGAVRRAVSAFDEARGGFGGAPRFPRAPLLDFLLRRSVGDDGGADARRIVDRTLEAMGRGGIRDHLGGGFHRYAVDARWLVPHFEKMLYDNALLARLYVDHHRLTGKTRSRRVAEDALGWLLDDLRDPQGAFYSSRDADSEGEEGRYYVWSAEEVDDVLGPENGELIRRTYDVSREGNWEGTNILHLPRGIEDVARSEGMDRKELEERLRDARARLLERRAGRKPPRRDEKILTGWNGLAVRALAEAGAALGRREHVEAAREAADFLLAELRRDGRLLHSWTDGDARIPGFLDDYASLGNAFLSLHEATLERRWLEEARWCVDRLLDLFWTEEGGVFHDTPADGEKLLIRPRDATDDPSPSGTSLAVELLLRGAGIFGREGWREIAVRCLTAERPTMERHPLSFGALLGALDRHLREPLEVVVVGEGEAEDTRSLLATVHTRYLPHRLVVGRDVAEEDRDGIPLLRARVMQDGRATAWVCRNRACREPVTTPHALDAQLESETTEGD